MVIRETKGSMVLFIPECGCNKKRNFVIWKGSRFGTDLDEFNSYAEDHEELHTLSRTIVDFIAETGKTQKEDIVEAFPDYKEKQLQIAANMSMYPLIFPKRRHASPAEFQQIKIHAHTLTEEYRKAKYAPVDDKVTEESNDK